MYQFTDKTDNFELFDQDLPKNGFWGRNFKNLNLDSESASLRYSVHHFSDKYGQLWTTGAKFAQKWILGSKFQNLKSEFGISILDILCATIFRQNAQLWIFRPKFAQKWILESEFQKSKSGFGISTSNIPCVSIFSQNGKLLIFWPKFGELAQLPATFWLKYCWGCCRELGGSWNELSAGG